MEWTRQIRLKLARRIRELSLEIQKEEFARCAAGGANFPETVENTIERIMERLAPLGFERANRDWTHLEEGVDSIENLYEDSPTHLWFETAQARIVKIRKDLAHKLLPLDLP